jgi:hypothetical protein
VSFASTLNTAASPPAWIGDRRGRAFNAGFGVQQSSGRGFVVVMA